MAVSQNFTSVYPLQLGGLTIPGYAALYAIILNFVVAIVLTLVFNALSVAAGRDETEPVDYTALAPEPVPLGSRAGRSSAPGRAARAPST